MASFHLRWLCWFDCTGFFPQKKPDANLNFFIKTAVFILFIDPNFLLIGLRWSTLPPVAFKIAPTARLKTIAPVLVIRN